MNQIISWVCTCPDFIHREVKCKHIWAVVLSTKSREVVKPRVSKPIDVHACVYCKSESLIKSGIRHNKHGGIQKFCCKAGSRYFTVNLAFERMKHSPQDITVTMQQYVTLVINHKYAT